MLFIIERMQPFTAPIFYGYKAPSISQTPHLLSQRKKAALILKLNIDTANKTPYIEEWILKGFGCFIESFGFGNPWWNGIIDFTDVIFSHVSLTNQNIVLTAFPFKEKCVL